MSNQIFRCCKRKPAFLVTYSVSSDEKEYFVCNECINLDCFSKYILSKVPMQVQNEKNFQSEISEQTDENKTESEKENEEYDENRINSEESEDNSSLTGGFIQ